MDQYVAKHLNDRVSMATKEDADTAIAMFSTGLPHFVMRRLSKKRFVWLIVDRAGEALALPGEDGSCKAV